uniref:Uncharacterized protein n=1 Tax=Hordeum vulgare subsp. vulgare TaxID=112509 RepID=A0A8I6X3J2_HORVV
MAARIGAVVLCLALIVSAGLVATPAEARGVAGVLYAPAVSNAAATSVAGVPPGRWSARRLQGDAAHKREVPGGPDPEHHH